MFTDQTDSSVHKETCDPCSPGTLLLWSCLAGVGNLFPLKGHFDSHNLLVGRISPADSEGATDIGCRSRDLKHVVAGSRGNVQVRNWSKPSKYCSLYKFTAIWMLCLMNWLWACYIVHARVLVIYSGSEVVFAAYVCKISRNGYKQDKWIWIALQAGSNGLAGPIRAEGSPPLLYRHFLYINTMCL